MPKRNLISLTVEHATIGLFLGTVERRTTVSVDFSTKEDAAAFALKMGTVFEEEIKKVDGRLPRKAHGA